MWIDLKAIWRRRRREDNPTRNAEPYPHNVHKEIWSPLDFDKKYLDLAQRFLENDENDDKDKAA
jgi:hypothetical protein